MTTAVELTQADCEQLFEQGFEIFADASDARFVGPNHPSPVPLIHPWIISHTATATADAWLVHVLPNTPWFEGHFPQQPILPGIVQIHWCVQLAEHLGYSAEQQLGVRRIKFVHPILPNAIARIVLRRQPEAHRCGFEVHSRLGLHSKGSLEYT